MTLRESLTSIDTSEDERFRDDMRRVDPTSCRAEFNSEVNETADIHPHTPAVLVSVYIPPPSNTHPTPHHAPLPLSHTPIMPPHPSSPPHTHHAPTPIFPTPIFPTPMPETHTPHPYPTPIPHTHAPHAMPPPLRI